MLTNSVHVFAAAHVHPGLHVATVSYRNLISISLYNKNWMGSSVN